jgi:hypothetical protein
MARAGAVIVIGLALSACSSKKDALDPLVVELFNFAPGFGGVHLNSPLELTFSVSVDPDTVNPDTIRIFTVTTTTEEPDPGAPAQGEFDVNANVVRFLPQIPNNPDLSDAGLRLGFTYTIEVPASPDVISPVKSIEGDPNSVAYKEFFTTLNTTILPAPGDVTAEPNLNSLSLFFIDEGLQNGVDPCPRESLPEIHRDSPQIIFSDPAQGEDGFGTITGIQPGLGTAFVRLDPITILFSEPIAPWRIRAQNVRIENKNLANETFDLFFFFRQDRSETRLQITVFDADSAFDQASVPQGTYELIFSEFTDLSGNPLVNESCTDARGTYALLFSTVSSPSQPTDFRLTFDDDDGDGHVDVGGLNTASNDPNSFPEHVAPFLGGVAVRQVDVGTPSPSIVATSANWGSVGFWTGCEVRFDNGFDPLDPNKAIPDVMRLRGGAVGAATPIIAPIAGDAAGRSSTAGSADGALTTDPGDLDVPQPAPPVGKINFRVFGSGAATLFTGDLNTGPITYHYYSFHLRTDRADPDTAIPALNVRSDSVYPLMIFVETDAILSGNVNLTGSDGQFGFDGPNDLINDPRPARNTGGVGGNGVAGGGDGGSGGAAQTDTGNFDSELLNGQTGGVPINVLGPLTQFDEANAGLIAMAPGGGGHWCFDMTDGGDKTAAPVPPNFQGGGGSGPGGAGTNGSDLAGVEPDCSDQGVGGKVIGTGIDFTDPVALCHGGAGGGGGGADDDSTVPGSEETADNISNSDRVDDGGGGGGGGGGFFGIYAGNDIQFGETELVDEGDPLDPDDDVYAFYPNLIDCSGGRGGSTYDTETPVFDDDVGSGNAGGGGGGGGICAIAGNQLSFVSGFCFATGMRGGNSPFFLIDNTGTPIVANDGTTVVGLEQADRTTDDEGGAGGGGVMAFLDSDGFDAGEIGAPVGNNANFFLAPTSVPFIDTSVMTQTQSLFDRETTVRLALEPSGGTQYVFDVYGDDPNEVLDQDTLIVTEFFDTLSDTVIYNRAQVLSNAPRYDMAYDKADLSNNLLQVFVDTTRGLSGSGLPDFDGELADGSFNNVNARAGRTAQIGLHFNSFPPAPNSGDPAIGDDVDDPQYDSTRLINDSTVDVINQRRFMRVRLKFHMREDLADLLNTFALRGALLDVIADDLGTPGLDNTLGNLDRAPQGAPAFAEVRVRFTP